MGLILKENFLENNIATTISTIHSKNYLLDENEIKNGQQLALAIISLLTSIILFFNGLYFWFSHEQNAIIKIVSVLCIILAVLLLTTSITLFVCSINIFNQIKFVSLGLVFCGALVVISGLSCMLRNLFCKTSN